MTDHRAAHPGGCDPGCGPDACDRARERHACGRRTRDRRTRDRRTRDRRTRDRRTHDRGTVDRRTFVARTAGALAAVALPLACVPPVLSVRPRHGVVRLDPAEHSALSEPGGFLRLQPTGRVNPVYVLALADGEYVALSSTCTHQGCTVGVQGDRLVCPCHGSTYDRRGRVLRGPAPDPLRSFPVETDDDGTLRITLEDA